MQIQRILKKSIKSNKIPNQAVIIQLLDKDSEHLAFIACHHKQLFSIYNVANDRETSHFLEEISNLEAELLSNYFQIAPEMKEKFGGWTGEMIITDENSQIVHHERPV